MTQGGEEDENNVSLYEDSGFGGTISTQKSASIESFKTRVSRQSSRISGSARSNSDITGEHNFPSLFVGNFPGEGGRGKRELC